MNSVLAADDERDAPRRGRPKALRRPRGPDGVSAIVSSGPDPTPSAKTRRRGRPRAPPPWPAPVERCRRHDADRGAVEVAADDLHLAPRRPRIEARPPGNVLHDAGVVADAEGLHGPFIRHCCRYRRRQAALTASVGDSLSARYPSAERRSSGGQGGQEQVGRLLASAHGHAAAADLPGSGGPSPADGAWADTARPRGPKACLGGTQRRRAT